MDAGERAAAERWLKETGFIATVEAAVNKACQAMPDDPAGYVVRSSFSHKEIKGKNIKNTLSCVLSPHQADRLLEVAASPTFIQVSLSAKSDF